MGWVCTRPHYCQLLHEVFAVTKQRAKHPIKIHIWGGISSRRATSLVMFTEIMNAQRLGAVFEAGLIPFIQGRFPDWHRLYQDNDSKHSSKCIKQFLKV